MLAFPSMLADAAECAGMSVPKNPDTYYKKDFPHFFVFCTMQCGRPTPYAGVHYRNAEIVASISDEDITKITPYDIEQKGFL